MCDFLVVFYVSMNASDNNSISCRCLLYMNVLFLQKQKDVNIILFFITLYSMKFRFCTVWYILI
jgi:hypothetical protein